ncbi:hypothetical protein ABTM75_20160, partial [Acinetobacter baumannii]
MSGVQPAGVLLLRRNHRSGQRRLPTIRPHRLPPMPYIIANPFTLTEFLLDSLPPEERAGVLVHPK